MLIKKVLGYLNAYILWIVVLLLGLWLAIISRSALLGFAALYAGELYSKQVVVRFWDKAYQVILGLAWLALMIICEEVFRKAVIKGNLLRKFTAVCGIELLLIFIFDFSLLVLQNWAILPLRLAVLILEFLLGVAFIFYWRMRRISKPA